MTTRALNDLDGPAHHDAKLRADVVEFLEDHDPTPDLAPTAAPNGDGLVAVVRNGWRLERLEGPKRARIGHKFEDVRTFAGWLKREAKPQTCDVLVGADELVARLEPRRVDSDEVRCTLTRHPTFAAWSKPLGAALSQRDLLRLVRGQARSLGAAFEPLLVAVQQIQVATAGEFRTELDLTGATRVLASTEKTSINVRIPSSLNVKTPIFAGVEDAQGVELVYSLELFVSMEATAGKPVVFSLDCPALELVLRDARRDLVEFLTRLLGGAFLVGIGTLATTPVPIGSALEDASARA